MYSRTWHTENFSIVLLVQGQRGEPCKERVTVANGRIWFGRCFAVPPVPREPAHTALEAKNPGLPGYFLFLKAVLS